MSPFDRLTYRPNPILSSPQVFYSGWTLLNANRPQARSLSIFVQYKYLAGFADLRSLGPRQLSLRFIRQLDKPRKKVRTWISEFGFLCETSKNVSKLGWNQSVPVNCRLCPGAPPFCSPGPQNICPFRGRFISQASSFKFSVLRNRLLRLIGETDGSTSKCGLVNKGDFFFFF